MLKSLPDLGESHRRQKERANHDATLESNLLESSFPRFERDASRLQHTTLDLDSILGSKKLLVHRLLDRTLPSRRRITTMLTLDDGGLLRLTRGVIFPACMLYVSELDRDAAGVEPKFYDPVIRPVAVRKTFPGQSGLLSNEVDGIISTLAVHRHLNGALRISCFMMKCLHCEQTRPRAFEVELDEASAEDEAAPNVLARTVTLLPANEMIGTQSSLSTSGALLDTISRGTIAISHVGKYRLGLFIKNETEGLGWRRIQIVDGKGLEAAGGDWQNAGQENIGSMVEDRHGRLLVSMRTNIPYDLNTISGHGYRQAGLWTMWEEKQGNVWRGRAHTLYSSDRLCGKKCGFLEDVSSSLTIDSDALVNCHQSFYKGYDQNLKTQTLVECLNSSIRCDHPGLCTVDRQLLQMYSCSLRCRLQHQSYHSAISQEGDALLSLVAYRCLHPPKYDGLHGPQSYILLNNSDNAITRLSHDACNKLHLCRVGDSSLQYVCWPKPMLSLTFSNPDHPLMSGLMGSANRLAFVAPNRLTDPHRRGSMSAWMNSVRTHNRVLNASLLHASPIVHYSWERGRFCSLRAASPPQDAAVGHRRRAAASSSTIVIRLRLPTESHKVGIVWQDPRECTQRREIEIENLVNVSWRPEALPFGVKVAAAGLAPSKPGLCMAAFPVFVSCTNGNVCEVSISWARGIAFSGIVSL